MIMHLRTLARFVRFQSLPSLMARRYSRFTLGLVEFFRTFRSIPDASVDFLECLSKPKTIDYLP